MKHAVVLLHPCSFSPTGSLCNTFVSQCYLLPVMDSIFVRKDHRGNGHGLQMLEDFVDSFKDDELGLKYPLTLAMQKGKTSASLFCMPLYKEGKNI